MSLLATAMALATPKHVPYHSWIGVDKSSINADITTPVDTIFSREVNTGGKWQRTGDIFEVSRTGDYYIAIHSHEPKCSHILLSDFAVEIDSFIPAAPANLTATPGTDSEPRKLSVTLSWSNPLSDRDESLGPTQKRPA